VTEPNEKEMLELIDHNIAIGEGIIKSAASRGVDTKHLERVVEIEKAIRRIIKERGEWQRRAKDLLDVRKNPNDAFRYIQESERLLFQIRDFREGEK